MKVIIDWRNEDNFVVVLKNGFWRDKIEVNVKFCDILLFF